FYTGSWAIQPEFSFPTAAVIADSRDLEITQPEVTSTSTTDVTGWMSDNVESHETVSTEPVSILEEPKGAQMAIIADEPVLEQVEPMITRSIDQPVTWNILEDPAAI